MTFLVDIRLNDNLETIRLNVYMYLCGAAKCVYVFMHVCVWMLVFGDGSGGCPH